MDSPVHVALASRLAALQPLHITSGQHQSIAVLVQTQNGSVPGHCEIGVTCRPLRENLRDRPAAATVPAETQVELAAL